jgi:integrase
MKGRDTMKVSLIARVQEMRDGKLTFQQKTVKDMKNGKPIPPKAEENATSFYLRFREGGKRVMLPVGQNFAEAVTALRNKQVAREYEKHGLDVPEQMANPEGRAVISESVAAWISELKTLDKAPATVYAYSQAANQFLAVCLGAGKRFMDQIDRAAVLAYVTWMRENVKQRAGGDPNGTIRARLQFLSVFLLAHGIANPLPKKDWPKVAQKEVLAFTTEEVNQILSKATSDETDLIQFFLFSGFRDDEVAHVFYTDIDWKRGTLNISPKPEYGFRIKNRQKRPVDIQLPADFLARMKARRAKAAKPDHLIFPSNTGRPDTALLARIRKAAKRGKYRGVFGCHKFRKTFGTLYGERFGIANAQALLGHADIRTTQKYLARTVIAKSAVEDLFAGVGK